MKLLSQECFEMEVREEWMQARVGELLPVPYFHVVFTLPDTHSIIEYLGRYTHKVAISNHRILSVDDDKVSFEYKDYRKAGKKGIMTLSNKEFTRRFALHILSQVFVQIRHYGILSGTWKRERLPRLQRQLGVKLQSANPEKNTFLNRYPFCKTGTLVTIMAFLGRAPPADSFRGQTFFFLLKRWVWNLCACLNKST